MESLLKQLVRGKALLFIFILGLGGSLQSGCHLTLISSPTPYIKSFINTTWTQRYGEALQESIHTFIWSAVVASYGFGALFGSISVRCVTSRLGRKRAMLWNNVISITALVFMWTSKHTALFEMILLSRFLFGFSGGLGMNLHVLYLGESALKKIRGTVTVTMSNFTALGKLLGQILGLSDILGKEDQWNILLCIPAFFSMIQLVTLPFFPEAPRYLLIEKGNVQQCKKALQCLWGAGEYKVEIEEMLMEQAALKGERSKSLLELLRDTRVRWQCLSLFIIHIAIQFCGVSAISVFSFSTFQEAGIPVDKIRYVTLGVGASQVLTSLTCGLLIDRVGRRVLLWASFGIMAVIMVLLTITLQLKDYAFWIPYSTVCLIFLFIICYGGGPAGVVPSLCHEMFVQSYRSAAFVLIGIVLWGSFTMLTFIYPFVLDSLKTFSFLPFTFVSLLASLYVFFIVPETNGKTPLEISEDFKKIKVWGSCSEDKCLETKL